jgi:hypothetical protein
VSEVGQIISCHHFFFAMLGDIDLMFGICVYNDELQIKFTFRSGPMIFGPERYECSGREY